MPANEILIVNNEEIRKIRAPVYVIMEMFMANRFVTRKYNRMSACTRIQSNYAYGGISDVFSRPYW